jgi:undecaprenyl-diphosphatase
VISWGEPFRLLALASAVAAVPAVSAVCRVQTRLQPPSGGRYGAWVIVRRPRRRLPRLFAALLAGFLALTGALAGFGFTGAALASPTATSPAAINATSARVGTVATGTPAKDSTLTTPKAIALGLIEGITEFLPISSTGHLLVAEKLMDIGTQDTASKDAADAYAVIIQLGAIVAVLLISWKRVLDVLQGLIGKSETGRRLLINLIAAFVPAAVVGVLLDKLLEKHLLKPVPVAIAWLVGGAAIIALAKKFKAAQHAGRLLDSMTPKDAVMIGVAQSVALWPGVSRSLVTILGAILLGFRLRDAVEFSFLLGLCTLSAAAGYSLLKDGSLVFDTFGTTTPLIGMVVAFVSAAVAVKWLVSYLNKHDLSMFGIYRLFAGVVTLGLVAANKL